MLKKLLVPLIGVIALISSCKKDAETHGMVFHVTSATDMNIRIQIQRQPDWPITHIVESGKKTYDYTVNNLTKESQVDILVATAINSPINGSLRIKGHDAPYVSASLNNGFNSVKQWQATAP